MAVIASLVFFFHEAKVFLKIYMTSDKYGGRELPLKILKFVGIIFVNFF